MGRGGKNGVVISRYDTVSCEHLRLDVVHNDKFDTCQMDVVDDSGTQLFAASTFSALGQNDR